MIRNFLNPKGHQYHFSGSKGMVIFLKVWIWPIGGVASGRVCACSLRSRLVFCPLSGGLRKPLLIFTIIIEQSKIVNVSEGCIAPVSLEQLLQHITQLEHQTFL